MNLIFTIVLVVGIMVVIVIQERCISELVQDNAEYKEAELKCINEIYDNIHKLEQQIRVLQQDVYLMQNGYKHYYDGEGGEE